MCVHDTMAVLLPADICATLYVCEMHFMKFMKRGSIGRNG